MDHDPGGAGADVDVHALEAVAAVAFLVLAGE